MKNRVTYKTKDGSLKEQVFDDFNEFADLVQDVAVDYYASGMVPEMSVLTQYDNMSKQEKVTNNEQPEREFLD